MRVLTAPRRSLQLIVQPVQARPIGHGGMFRRELCRELIQRSPHRIDLEHLILGDRAHDQAAAFDARREVLRLQAEYGFAYGCTTHAELARELLLGQAIARSQMPREDCLAQRGIGDVGDRASAGMCLPERAQS